MSAGAVACYYAVTGGTNDADIAATPDHFS